VKVWPYKRFVNLIGKLSALAHVIVVGGKEETARSRQLGFDTLPGADDLTGKTSLVELAALLKGCTLLISGDSGPVHLACCVKTPVLALFRDDIPGKGPLRWGPWGPGKIVIAKHSLYDISEEEVFEKALMLLQGAGERRG
jgi:heptosyltransferase-1